MSASELTRAYRLYEASVAAAAAVADLHEEFDSVAVDDADQHNVHATATAFDVSRSRGETKSFNEQLLRKPRVYRFL